MHHLYKSAIPAPQPRHSHADRGCGSDIKSARHSQGFRLPVAPSNGAGAGAPLIGLEPASSGVP